MSQLPGSPAYGLALSDPPRDRFGPWRTFWLGLRRLRESRAIETAPAVSRATRTASPSA